MPSLEEAREQAFTYGDGVCFLCRWEGESVGVPGPYNKATEAGPFCERHNAGGQYDEQRIAALVEDESVVEAMAEAYYHATWGPMPVWVNAGSHDKEIVRTGIREALRALADQTARDEVPE